jgi:gas vesicle structural protein
MAVVRTVARASLIDVLDRVLDKGIVIDAWVRVALVGIDLITVEARIVVASIETWFRYSEDFALVVSRPANTVATQRSAHLELSDRVPRVEAGRR